MARVNRKRRARKVATDSLTDLWNRGLPPPESSFVPSDDTASEIFGLYFLDEGAIPSRQHPYREEWIDALGASNRPVRKPVPEVSEVPPTRS